MSAHENPERPTAETESTGAGAVEAETSVDSEQSGGEAPNPPDSELKDSGDEDARSSDAHAGKT